jgi:ABC-type sugar transport system substrate-binding protein
MKKVIVIFLLVGNMILCSGCNCQVETPIEADSNFVLGFSQLGNESGWRLGNTESIKNAALENEVDLIYLNAEQKYDSQAAHIRRLIANQVDIIAIAPIITEGWDNVLGEAKRAGIPVILTDRCIVTTDQSLYVTFIGSDFEIC